MSEVRYVGPTIRPEVIVAEPHVGTHAVVELAQAVPQPPQDDITVAGVLVAIAGVLIGGKVVHVARNLPGIQGIALRLGLALWKTIAPKKAVEEDDAKDAELARLRADNAVLRQSLYALQERDRKAAEANLQSETGWTEAETDQINRSLLPKPAPLTSEPPPAPRG